MIIMFLLLAAVQGPDGPLGKFDNRTPDETVSSSRQMWDVERCFVGAKEGLAGAPNVFWAPDRPGHVSLLWQGTTTTIHRVDLDATQGGVTVRRWGANKSLYDCAGVSPPSSSD